MTIATGEQATAADVVAAIAAARKVVTGTYTGNDSASRQITVGFVPKLVIILRNSTPNAQWTLIGAESMVHWAAADYHGKDAANCYIHGSDGFVVSLTSIASVPSNSAATGYAYFTISA